MTAEGLELFVKNSLMATGFCSFVLVAIDIATNSRYKVIERAALVSIGGYGVSLVALLLASAR